MHAFERGLRPCLEKSTQSYRLEEQAKASEHYREVVGLAAATLASLHRLQFESQAVQSVQMQVEKLRPQVTALHGLAPWLALQVEALLQQIEQAGARQMTTEGLITGEVR